MNTPQRIRIIEKGWQQFTGNMGGVDFADGLSVAAVLPIQANHIGSLIRVEAADDNTQVGASAVLLETMETSAPVVEEMARSNEPEKTTAPIAPVGEYTREQLEKIADDHGIAGLREIATKHGLKGRGIQELIGEILAKQAPK